MKIVKKNIDELKPAPYNPRINLKQMDKDTYNKLKNSITKFGLVEPIIYNKKTGYIVGGHQRLAVLKDIGETEVDVVEIEADINDEKTLNIALNKITGDWDTDKLSLLLNDLESENYDLSLTGFDDKELNKLLTYFDDEDTAEVADIIERESKYNVKQGEVFQLGDHLLQCGDATDSGDIKGFLGENKADMTFTDPPYNVDYGSIKNNPRWKRTATKTQNKIKNDALTEQQWQVFVDKYMKNLLEYTDGSIYIFMGNKEMYTNKHIFENNGGHWSSFIIWVKDRFVLSLQDYHRQYEPILYGWKEGDKHYWSGDRTQGDIWEIKRPSSSVEHPTMKPVDLCKRAILNSSKKNNIVFDPFGGSGSTLIACEQTKRRCYMMEIDPHYCSVTIERWENYTGKKHKKIKGGEK